ncbi:hypothetical protein NXS19_014168 [Fusarium pseudograminearum]|nr:hypothetical protein NXS19_014168 [Fusarium pseudograminearum]
MADEPSHNQQDQGDGDSDEYVADDDETETSSLHEEEFTDERAVASGYHEQKFIKFFQILNADIVSKHNAPWPSLIPGLRSAISLFHHQQRAVAAALYAKDSRFKGMILADPLVLARLYRHSLRLRYRKLRVEA